MNIYLRIEIYSSLSYTESMHGETETKLTRIQQDLALLREATQGTSFEGRIYLVGGALRDRELDLPEKADLDMTVDGDAVELAKLLYEKGVSSHSPALYPRFGTAMLHIGEANSMLELVTARAESYLPDSRKPEVRASSLYDDAFRRDFTINTLMENLHTGEHLDLTGKGRVDIAARIIRTPLDPHITFHDDPLRMLRALRFAASLSFSIDAEVWQALKEEKERLQSPAISSERVRDEFSKIMLLPGRKARRGLNLLHDSELLTQFLWEMIPMVGCMQGGWHIYDVWEHSLTAVEILPDEASLALRLAILWHDIAKPETRSELDGKVRFYGHAAQGAEMVRTIMNRLKYPNDEIRTVTRLVQLHMRLGEYRPDWNNAAVKRLIRDCGPLLDDLFTLTHCDRGAMKLPPEISGALQDLDSRIKSLNAVKVNSIASPFGGKEIMALLNTVPGPHIAQAKEFLINEILDERLDPEDKEACRISLIRWWEKEEQQTQRVNRQE